MFERNGYWNFSIQHAGKQLTFSTSVAATTKKWDIEKRKTRTAAEKSRNRILLERGYGTPRFDRYINAQKVRFEDYEVRYRKTYASTKKDKNYKYRVKHLLNYFSGLYIYKIDAFTIESYKAARVKEVSKTTVDRELALLKTMFSKAVDWGFLPENPARRVKLFREDKVRKRILTPDEITRLIRSAVPIMVDMIVFALNTGLRKSEQRLLHLRDINLFENVITVVTETAKSKRERIIPINVVVKDIILRHSKGKSPDDYLFGSDHRELWDGARKLSGVKDVVWHDLRRTFGAQLLMNGVDLSTVQELLGHSTPMITKTHYGHILRSHKQKAVDNLDNLVNIGETEDRKPVLAEIRSGSDDENHSEEDMIGTDGKN